MVSSIISIIILTTHRLGSSFIPDFFKLVLPRLEIVSVKTQRRPGIEIPPGLSWLSEFPPASSVSSLLLSLFSHYRSQLLCSLLNGCISMYGRVAQGLEVYVS